MRTLVKFQVIGDTLHEVVGNATESWREFVGDKTAELPNNTEITVEQSSSDKYVATVFVQAKVEDAI